MKITPRRARWIGRAGATVLRALGLTWRMTILGPVGRRDVVYAFSHGEMLMAAVAHRDRPLAVIISQHGDGELIAQAIGRLGMRAVRGSSSRGGARAALEMIRDHRDVPWAITPDGPRGPRGSVAPGVVLLAAQSGRPVVPIGFAARPAKRLGSWDRFTIPAPFARVVACLGDPIAIPPTVAGSAIDAACAQIAAAIDGCRAAAERVAGVSSLAAREQPG